MKALKTRGNNKYTESAFWSMIRSSLRKSSQYWSPAQLALNNAKRNYTGSNKRQKFEYQCNQCKNYFIRTDVQIDHIQEVGSLKSGKDLEMFVERLFCEVEGYQILCKSCHLKKTHGKEE